MSQTKPHDEFLELCAVSTSGQLTDQEQKKLDQHLAICTSCREVLKQYQAVIDNVIPPAAAELASDHADPGPNWSFERAESDLFERIDRDERAIPHSREVVPRNGSRNGASSAFEFPRTRTWRNVWALYAAGIVLFAALGVLAYQLGVRRGNDSVKIQLPPPPSLPQNRVPLEGQLSNGDHEREVARSQIAQRDQEIADLRRQLDQQATEIGNLKTAQSKLDSNLSSSEKERQDLGQRLSMAQSTAHALQQKLDGLARQSSQEGSRAEALEAKIADLNHLLEEREATIDQQQELLARDRDIRELMGARDLYIAEVHDVARTGATNKPYGRVFYTKGKSLIFYAYDLDQQNGLKATSTFQAWGRRGPEWQQALPLGIFYEDNASKKRWVLKLDDPKRLAQIDAVFVTVEPKGGSQKPSDKRLLFAYLRVDANHP